MRNKRPTRDLAGAKADGLYNIGEAAAHTGVSAKMIRHYEALGLMPAAERTYANYRVYGERDLHSLRFIKRARGLGFSMKEIAQLLGLWQNTRRSSSTVKRMALDHVAALEAKIKEMDAMRATLLRLARHCHGDNRPDCPILDDLGGAH